MEHHSDGKWNPSMTKAVPYRLFIALDEGGTGSVPFSANVDKSLMHGEGSMVA